MLMSKNDLAIQNRFAADAAAARAQQLQSSAAAARQEQLSMAQQNQERGGIYEHAKSLDLSDRERSERLFQQMFGLLGSGGTGVEGSSSWNDSLDVESRLARLLDDPESIQNTGSYQFRLAQGQEALERSLGAKGMLGSGNRLMDLQKYGQDMASQEYEGQFDRLSSLLGKQYDYKGGMYSSLANVLGQGALGRGGTTDIWNAYNTGVNMLGNVASSKNAMTGQLGAAQSAASGAIGAANAGRVRETPFVYNKDGYTVAGVRKA